MENTGWSTLHLDSGRKEILEGMDRVGRKTLSKMKVKVKEQR